MTETETESLEAPPLVKAAAAVQGVSGLYVALAAFQLLISLEFYGRLLVVQYLNWALLALGIVQLVFALGTLRARLRSAIVSTAIAWILAPTILGWAAVCISVSIFSCIQAGAILLVASAAMLSPFAIAGARKAEAVRKKLEAEGMDLGM
jgi:hypothetical protein